MYHDVAGVTLGDKESDDVGNLDIKDAIIRHLRRLHLYRQQHRTTMLLAHPNHLTHGGGGLNDPIGKHDRGIVPVGI